MVCFVAGQGNLLVTWIWLCRAQKEAQQRAKEGFQPNHRQTKIDMFMRQAKRKQALAASLPLIQGAGSKEPKEPLPASRAQLSSQV